MGLGKRTKLILSYQGLLGYGLWTVGIWLLAFLKTVLGLVE
jgi:hypothetical protein